MLFGLFVYFSQARKEICICNHDCTSLCPTIYFNASSNSSFLDFINPHIKDEKEINFYLYSQSKGFSFSFDFSYFQNQKLTLKVLSDSKEILLYIKKGLKEKYVEVKIMPGYKIILPNLIPILEYHNNVHKLISNSNTPSSTTIPISLGMHQLNHNGDAACDNGPPNSGGTYYSLASLNSKTDSRCNCPNTESELDKPSAYKCGFRCWGSATYDYTFKGVQFAIYGTRDTSKTILYVRVDENPEEEVDLYYYVSEDDKRIDYAIIYTSSILKYDYHKVQIYSKNSQKYEINKFVYWPSITAKRLNCTSFTLNGNGDNSDNRWVTETDGIGGIRKYRNQNGAALIPLQCTKFWIYGILDSNFSDISIQYNGKSYTSTTRSPDNIRRENVLIYESPEFDYTPIVVNLKPTSGILYVHSIFYEVPPSPTQTPIPISVGLQDVKLEQYSNCGTYSEPTDVNYNFRNNSFGCTFDYETPQSYQCGIRCWGTGMKASYTFKGVKFGLFGKYDSIFGTINIDLDGQNVANINVNGPTLRYSNLFESDVYVYKEHTVTVTSTGIYELYKLVYWPTMYAIRVNSSQLDYSSGKRSETDRIGGVYHWYDYYDAKPKYYQTKDLRCSRFWLYIVSDRNYGDVTLTINSESYSVSQETPQRTIGKLLLESDEFEYKPISIKGSSDGYLTFYCIYYHSEPDFEYIDKNFYITLPYIQILVTPNSRINQISGCNFSHISEILDYFIILEKDVLFFDNTFEYSNSDNERYALPITIHYNSQGSNFLRIRNCTFIQSTRKANSKKASVFYCSNDYQINVDFQSCIFDNCGLSSSEMIIQIENQNSYLKMDNCTFKFTQNSCKAIKMACSRAIINDCKFSKSGPIIIEQTDDPSSIGEINNIAITRCTFDSCSISDYSFECIKMLLMATTSLTFEYNVISNIKTIEYDDYAIYIDGNNKIEQLELKNITFRDNSCKSLYGGGVGMVLYNINKLLFTGCNFINNEARKNTARYRNMNIIIPGGDYYNGDGGAIQIGFYCYSNKASLNFEACAFRNNKAERHGGALAIQTLSTVEINNCLFESNEANYDFKSSAELLFENHFNKKKQGRAGAIYINPSFTYNQQVPDNCENIDDYLKKILISNCQFLHNSAYDGYAIYIEGDEVPTEFVINSNIFNRNYNYDENSANNDPNLTVRGVITTEIHTINKDVTEQNEFLNVYSKKLTFVDHYGSILATNEFSRSSVFTCSNEFSNTKKFSKSFEFSNSEKFTKSEEFSTTRCFSKSLKFANTKEFSHTVKFSKSFEFSNSKEFTKSEELSTTRCFSRSEAFTNSREFSNTAFVYNSKTNLFTKYLVFSSSSSFSESSSVFSNSFHFSDPSFYENNSSFSQLSYFSKYFESKSFSDEFQTDSKYLYSKIIPADDSSSSEIAFLSLTAQYKESSLITTRKQTQEAVIMITNNKPNRTLIIGVVVGSLLLLVIVILIVTIFLWKKNKANQVSENKETSQEVNTATKDASLNKFGSHSSPNQDSIEEDSNLNFWL